MWGEESSHLAYIAKEIFKSKEEEFKKNITPRKVPLEQCSKRFAYGYDQYKLFRLAIKFWQPETAIEYYRLDTKAWKKYTVSGNEEFDCDP